MFDDWFSTITADPDDLPDFNADEWSKMFGTSTYCIPNNEEPEEFKPMYSTPTKQELDDPMVNKHFEQDIDISNPLSQPHQTYSEAVQRQRQSRQDNKPKSMDSGQSTAESYRNNDQQVKSRDKESTSVIKHWSEPIGVPNTQRTMDHNHAELPHNA